MILNFIFLFSLREILEAGASDGLFDSHSLFFEREIGWRGICVEPNLALVPVLQRNRPDCFVVKKALCPSVNSFQFSSLKSESPDDQSITVGREEPSYDASSSPPVITSARTEAPAPKKSASPSARFLRLSGPSGSRVDHMSGLIRTYEAQHRDRAQRILTEVGGVAQEVEVSCTTLASLLLKFSQPPDGLLAESGILDLLVLDLEGAELQVLQDLKDYLRALLFSHALGFSLSGKLD